MDRRRAAWALLALAACIAGAKAAPTASNQTALDLYDEHTEGCYYNFQHYGEGDRIMTNEPCLNCTCHNRMLMCYLRVCPFTKAIGQDCTVEKRADQCCPIVTCPDVPVDLLTSTSTSSPAEYGGTGVGKVDNYGCSINGKYFPEGAKVPQTPGKPCEHCYCIRNMTTCVMQECTLHVDGCTPIYHKDVCCPVRYFCDHPDEMPLLDDMTTTVRPTPGFLLTTTSTEAPVTEPAKRECVENDQVYQDGALIKTEKPCVHCYCMKGDIVCVVQECGTPMENEGKNCTSLPPRDGQCCPDTYICEGDEAAMEITTEIPYEESTTLLPPRRVIVEGSGYRNEPDFTELPTIATEIEGSGEDQEQYKPTEQPTTQHVLEGELGSKFGEPDEGIEEIAKPTEVSVAEEEKATTEPDRGLNTVPSSEDETPSDQEKTTPRSEIIVTEPTSVHDQELGPTTPSQVEQESTEPSAQTSPEFVEPTGPVSAEEKTTVASEIPVEKSTEPSLSLSTEPSIEEITTPVNIQEESPKPSLPTLSSELMTEEPSQESKPTTSVASEEESSRPSLPELTTLSPPAATEPSTFVGEEKTTPTQSADTTIAPSSYEPKSTESTTLGEQEEITVASVPKETTPKELEETTEISGLNTIPSDLAEEETLKPSGFDETTVIPEVKTTEPPSISEEEPVTSKLPEESSETPVEEKSTTRYDIQPPEPSATTESIQPYEAVTTDLPIEKEATTSSQTESLPEQETEKPSIIEEISQETATTPGYQISQDTVRPSEESEAHTTVSQLPEQTETVMAKEPTTESFTASTTLLPALASETPASPADKIDESETTSINPDDNEIGEDVTQIPGRIPGEGDCLLNGKTYKNESVIPSTNKCHSSCKCISSIVKCDPILCSPPPEYMDNSNCQPTYDTPDSCCPTYVCDHTMETVPPKPHSQMSGTESPLSTPSLECDGDQCVLGEGKEPVTASVGISEQPQSTDCGPEGCPGSKEPTIQSPTTTRPEIESEVCDDPEKCIKVKVPEVSAEVPQDTPCEGEQCETKTESSVPCEGEQCTEEAKPSAPCEGDQCETKTEANVTEPSSTCEGEQCETKTEPIVPCEGEQCETKTEIPITKPSASLPCEGDQCETKTEPSIPCEGEQCETKTEPSVSGPSVTEPSATVPSIACEGEQCKTKAEAAVTEPSILCEGEQCKTQTEPSVHCEGEQCNTQTEASATEPSILCEGEQCEPKTESSVPCEGEQCKTKTEPGVSCEGEQCETKTETGATEPSITEPSVTCKGEQCDTKTSAPCEGEQCETKTEIPVTKPSAPLPCEGDQCETKTEPSIPCEGEQCETKTEPSVSGPSVTEPSVTVPSVACEGEQCETKAEAAVTEPSVTVPSVACEGEQCETKAEAAVTEPSIPCEGEQCRSETEPSVTETSISCEGDQCETKTEAAVTESSVPCEGEQCQTQTELIVTVPSISCDGEQCETKTEPSAECQGEQCKTKTEAEVPCEGEQCETKTETAITESSVLCEGEQCKTQTEPSVSCEGEQCKTQTEPSVTEPSKSCEGEQCETRTEPSIPCDGEQCDTKPVTPQTCANEEECKRVTVPQTSQQCEGEQCKIKPETSVPCEGEECKESGVPEEIQPECQGETCTPGSTDSATTPSTVQKDESCTEESGCKSPDDILAECVGNNCRRAPQETAECKGPECVQQTPVTPDEQTSTSEPSKTVEPITEQTSVEVEPVTAQEQKTQEPEVTSLSPDSLTTLPAESATELQMPEEQSPTVKSTDMPSTIIPEQTTMKSSEPAEKIPEIVTEPAEITTEAAQSTTSQSYDRGTSVTDLSPHQETEKPSQDEKLQTESPEEIAPSTEQQTKATEVSQITETVTKQPDLIQKQPVSETQPTEESATTKQQEILTTPSVTAEQPISESSTSGTPETETREPEDLGIPEIGASTDFPEEGTTKSSQDIITTPGLVSGSPETESPQELQTELPVDHTTSPIEITTESPLALQTTKSTEDMQPTKAPEILETEEESTRLPEITSVLPEQSTLRQDTTESPVIPEKTAETEPQTESPVEPETESQQTIAATTSSPVSETETPEIQTQPPEATTKPSEYPEIEPQKTTSILPEYTETKVPEIHDTKGDELQTELPTTEPEKMFTEGPHSLVTEMIEDIPEKVTEAPESGTDTPLATSGPSEQEEFTTKKPEDQEAITTKDYEKATSVPEYVTASSLPEHVPTEKDDSTTKTSEVPVIVEGESTSELAKETERPEIPVTTPVLRDDEAKTTELPEISTSAPEHAHSEPTQYTAEQFEVSTTQPESYETQPQSMITEPSLPSVSDQEVVTKAPVIEQTTEKEAEIQTEKDQEAETQTPLQETSATEQPILATELEKEVTTPKSQYDEQQTDLPVVVIQAEGEATKTPKPTEDKLPSDITEPIPEFTTQPPITELPAETSKLPEELKPTSEPKVEFSETTPYLVELEEHTHKVDEEVTTTLPSEELTTLQPETHETKQEEQVPEEIQTETPVKETEKPYDGQEEPSVPDVEPSAPAQTTPAIPEETPEKTTESPAEEAPVGSSKKPDMLDNKFGSEPDEEATYKPEEEKTTPAIPVETESPEKVTSQPEKEMTTPSIPVESGAPSETMAPEEEPIPAKATTTKIEEETTAPSVSYTKPDEKPSDVYPSTPAQELPKPGLNELQPTDEIPSPEEESQFPTGGYGQEPDYAEEDQTFGPGTCRYGGKVYVSAQQIPRDDPCDFCFCFRSDIICLQQSCPPPIHGCHEEPIQGFCCPRYECPVSMATTLNVTTTTTTTTTTLPPHFLPHAYKGAAQRKGCQIKGHTYKVGEVVRASSGPCLHCTCGGDGQMKCDPKQCTPEPMLRQMIAAAVSAKRRR